MKHCTTILLLTMLLISCGQQTDQRQTNKVLNSEGEANFVWNFENPKTIIYHYSQEVANRFVIGEEGDDQNTQTSADGTLKVVVKESNMADLNLQVSTSFVYPKMGDTMKRENPPTYVQDMAADGSIDDNNTETMFKMLFPLPSSSLGIGETVSIPMKIPLRTTGTVLYTKGNLALTYVGDTVLLERKCAMLEGIIDVTDTKIPDGMDAKVDGGTTGKGKYYFDLKDGLFVKVTVNMTMEYTIEMESTGNMFDGNSYMKNVNFLEVVLEEIED